MSLAKSVTASSELLPVARPFASTGYIHGAIWYSITTGALSWDAILKLSICQTPYELFNCLHPVGHGFLYNHAAASFHGNSVFKTVWLKNTSLRDIPGYGFEVLSMNDADAVALAVDDCAKGPSQLHVHICTTGVFHGAFENGDFEGKWTSPCETISLPAFCYVYMMHYGLGEPRRLQSFARSSRDHGLVQLCPEHSSDELHVRCCIHGLAARGFTTYWRTVTLLRNGTFQGANAACKFQARTSFLEGPMAGRTAQSEVTMCDLLFESDHVDYSSDPVLDLSYWCSLLVPGLATIQSRNRYIACISGSVGTMSDFGGLPKDYNLKSQLRLLCGAMSGAYERQVCLASVNWMDGMRHLDSLYSPSDIGIESTA